MNTSEVPGPVSDKWKMSPRDRENQPWSEEKDKEMMDLKMSIYAAQIDRMDRGIGRVLDKIKALGKEDNTLVMFLADNGGCHEGGPRGRQDHARGWSHRRYHGDVC